MTTNKPEVVIWTNEGNLRRVREMPHTGGKAKIKGREEQGFHVGLIRLSDYEALQAECEKLRRDAERIEWLEDQAKKSRTGISFDYHCYAEDGYIVNRGYRFMRRHFASGFKDSLRKAIDAAMQEENK